MKVNWGRLAILALGAMLVGGLSPGPIVALILGAGVGVFTGMYWPFLERREQIKAGGTD